MIIALFSLIGFFILWTLIGLLVYRRFSVRLCAPCAAVCSTWVWMYGASFFGVAVDTTVLAILMGSSVAGAMYAAQRVVERRRWPGWWWMRMLMLVAGFVIVFTLIAHQWILLVETIILALSVATAGLGITYILHRSRATHAPNDALDHCC